VTSLPAAVQNRFIALLKLPFKFADDYPRIGRGKAGDEANTIAQRGVDRGQIMARFEILDSNAAPLGAGPMSADMLFEIGMMYSVGRDTPVDLISAHKWFNLAAVRGSTEAIRLRREVADQMSDAEIAVAQRAARDWLRGNLDMPAPVCAMAA
jgi:TPR repeat protein